MILDPINSSKVQPAQSIQQVQHLEILQTRITSLLEFIKQDILKFTDRKNETPVFICWNLGSNYLWSGDLSLKYQRKNGAFENKMSFDLYHDITLDLTFNDKNRGFWVRDDLNMQQVREIFSNCIESFNQKENPMILYYPQEDIKGDDTEIKFEMHDKNNQLYNQKIEQIAHKIYDVVSSKGPGKNISFAINTENDTTLDVGVLPWQSELLSEMRNLTPVQLMEIRVSAIDELRKVWAKVDCTFKDFNVNPDSIHQDLANEGQIQPVRKKLFKPLMYSDFASYPRGVLTFHISD